MPALGHIGRSAALAAAGLMMAAAAQADPAANYPDKPVNLIVGFAPGGGVSHYGRALAAVADKHLGQPIVVVNQPGGAQLPALRTTGRATPDGYTAMLASAGTLVLSAMLRDPGISFFDDFKMIGQVGVIYSTLVAPKPGPFKTPQEIVAAANANPGKLRWAHPGRGTMVHLAAVAWLQANNIEHLVQDVPFTGGAPARTAILGNQVDFGAIGLNSTTGFMEELEIIGLFANDRDPIRDDAPTMKERASPFVEVFTPVIVIVPKDTPDAIVDKLAVALKDMVADERFESLNRQTGLATIYKDKKESRELMLRLRDEWKPVIARMKAQQEKEKVQN